MCEWSKFTSIELGLLRRIDNVINMCNQSPILLQVVDNWYL